MFLAGQAVVNCGPTRSIINLTLFSTYRLSEDTLAKVLTKETSWADRNVGKEITRLFYEELLADIIAKSYLGESKTRNKEKFKDPPLDSQS